MYMKLSYELGIHGRRSRISLKPTGSERDDEARANTVGGSKVRQLLLTLHDIGGWVENDSQGELQ